MKPKRTLERYGGAQQKHDVMKPAASDRQRAQDTDCRNQDQRPPENCPRPGGKATETWPFPASRKPR